MHPLSQLPLLSVLVLTLRRSLPNFPSIPPPPLGPFLVLFRHALSASGHPPPLPLDLLYLAYPAATLPTSMR